MIGIGILVGTGTLRSLQRGDSDPRLEALLRANEQVAEELGIELFFFTLDAVNFQRQRIKGTYKVQGKWRQKLFSYPHALYRRFSMTEGDRVVHAALLRQLRAQGTVFLNYQIKMNKWEIHQCLLLSQSLIEYLPPTRLITSDQELWNFLAENPTTYLKACVGGRGKQVMRVEGSGKEGFTFAKFDRRLIQGRLSWLGLARTINDFFGGAPYIAQRGIQLLQVNGRHIDFRAEVQRGKLGEIRVAAIPVRIARDQSPITTHSMTMAVEEFALHNPELIPNYKEFHAQAKEFLSSFYMAVEGCFGRCGELGIDFALDRQGKWWFIEANAQSAKVSFFKSYPEESIAQSFISLLEYAQFLVQEIK